MNDTSPDLLDRVRGACAGLARTGEPVTFPKVAEHTGISRATLYRRHELREIIDTHRNPDGATTTVTALATQIDQLRQSLDAVAAKVRRHEEDLRVLKRVNRPKRK